jgi:hypothetical protein
MATFATLHRHVGGTGRRMKQRHTSNWTAHWSYQAPTQPYFPYHTHAHIHPQPSLRKERSFCPASLLNSLKEIPRIYPQFSFGAVCRLELVLSAGVRCSACSDRSKCDRNHSTSRSYRPGGSRTESTGSWDPTKVLDESEEGSQQCGLDTDTG